MGQKKMVNTTRKLTKVSKYSYVLSIPKEIIEKYGWRERQRMAIVDKGRGKIEISDYRKR